MPYKTFSLFEKNGSKAKLTTILIPMISIIICSRHTDISEELKVNIQTTIGLEYELVIIDNSKNEYSIFQAYNEGVRRAKYPYLCFMHEDILYHTQDWGEKVIEHLKDEKVGLIGVGGCHFLSKYPVSLLSWKVTIRNSFYSFNYIQGDQKNQVNKKEVLNNLQGGSVNVLALDGMWFCLKRDLFEHTKLKFDEENYSGFHFYDFDICMQVYAQKMDTKIIPDILIEHFSTGNFDKVWYDNAFVFYKKWKNYLPAAVGLKLTNEEIKATEYDLVMEFIQSAVQTQDTLEKQIQSIRHSKKYRLGCFLLKPLNWIKNEF